MIIRCISPEQGLTLGYQYLVVGVAFVVRAAHSPTGPFFDIVDDRYGVPRRKPADAFAVVDGRVSAHWTTAWVERGGDFLELAITHPTLLDEDFTMALDEYEPNEVQEFARLVAMLQDEFPPSEDRVLSEGDWTNLVDIIRHLSEVSGRDLKDTYAAGAEAPTLHLPADVKERATQVIRRILDSPDPVRVKSERIQSSLWTYMPGTRGIEWLGGLLNAVVRSLPN